MLADNARLTVQCVPKTLPGGNHAICRQVKSSNTKQVLNLMEVALPEERGKGFTQTAAV